MDKKSAVINRLQNIAIILLSLSAAFLLLRTPLFGTLAEQTLPELAEGVFSAEPSTNGAVEVELSGLTAPVRVVYTGEYTRCGADALTMADDGFSRAGSLLSEALSSAGAMVPSTEEAFLDALEKPGIYYDFIAGIPLEILCDTLGASVPISHNVFVRRALLCLVADTASLYLLDQSGTCYAFSTALRGAVLSEFLCSLEGIAVDFAFTGEGAYHGLSPFTLIMGEPTTCYMLSASGSLTADLSELLRLAEFNPHTENRYTESSGTTVVREAYGTLRITADGTVTYRGGSAEAGALYTVSTDRSVASLTESVAAAQRLASALLQKSGGAASLYLSGVEENAKGCTVTLDYVISGTPLCFADGSHAVSVTVEGSNITAFSLHFRSYALTDIPALVLPIRQAAAIARKSHTGCELSVFYVDSGTESVGVSWLPN